MRDEWIADLHAQDGESESQQWENEFLTDTSVSLIQMTFGDCG
jgi:hypothetical protein